MTPLIYLGVAIATFALLAPRMPYWVSLRSDPGVEDVVIATGLSFAAALVWPMTLVLGVGAYWVMGKVQERERRDTFL